MVAVEPGCDLEVLLWRTVGTPFTSFDGKPRRRVTKRSQLGRTMGAPSYGVRKSPLTSYCLDPFLGS